MKALLILACCCASCSSAPKHEQKTVTAPSPFADALDACSAIERELDLLDASRGN